MEYWNIGVLEYWVRKGKIIEAGRPLKIKKEQFQMPTNKNCLFFVYKTTTNKASAADAGELAA